MHSMSKNWKLRLVLRIQERLGSKQAESYGDCNLESPEAIGATRMTTRRANRQRRS